MNAIAKGTQTSRDFEQLKNRLKTTWMAGDYDLFARSMEKGAEQFFQRLGVTAGTRLLDVGCGAGQLALIAARAGAQVNGCDIATNWLKRARARAAAEKLEIRFEEGDAESLPYADAQFDAVVSLIGAMFAPRPDLVAAELTRVCRPGGMIAMANWTPDGFVGQMFRTISKQIAPSSMPPPVLWGDEATVRDRLREGIADLKFARRVHHFEYSFPPDAVVDFHRRNYGPMSRAFASLDVNGREKLRGELVRLWSAHNYSDGGTTRVDAEYLEVIATRGRNILLESQPNARHKIECTTSPRSELLADRIEEAAADLAAFAEGLSEAEWRAPVSGNGTEGRSVGVIVHHVASVYPIEINLARAIADGADISDVTWEVFAELNANHGQDQGGVTKTAALELLRRNSRNAAAAVRAFTDEELDRAAPSLIGLVETPTMIARQAIRPGESKSNVACDG
jgi:ubiquinone/menaquinone biosynthesis C-methylase UbiE